eukprot:TRINITY_DN3914_c1_g1_i1.p1 TRINITY_DN3914_c1_g1~~TRINITY_DN3914_c1_g1_i1.p1  ORF type:complete len:466 (-),score=98.02 TRINITY_DN3914_c1_g1_i1:72-1469(-)
MGNSLGYDPIGAPKKDGTTLVELNIDHIKDAHGLIGERPSGSFVPVVLIPKQASPCCGACCMVSVPDGFSAIVTQFGGVVEGDNDDGTWSPGCHCFNPLNNVDYLVTKQLIIFDTPVKECKTKDGISVNLDVMIVFEIEKGRSFVYGMGPQKFDSFLRDSQDEAIRAIAIDTSIDKVQDLRGSNANEILEELNKRFERYGVKCHSFTVKDVVIPQEIAQDAEDKTLFEPMTNRSRMQQTFDRLHINHSEGQKKLGEECENARQAADQKALVKQQEAKRETGQVLAQTEKDINELESAREMEVKKVISDAGLELAKLKSQILAIERDMKNGTEADTSKILFEAQAYAKQKQTQAAITTASCESTGKQALGEAEGEAAVAFQAKRAFEGEGKRLDILQKLVSRGNRSKIATSQENTVSLSEENAAVTQVAAQGLEALRAKLAEITVTSLSKMEPERARRPSQLAMRE